FRCLILPSVRPYFISSVRMSIGLAWKAGIAAEIITMPKNSIGTMIGEAKQYIETSVMFAWTLTVIVLSLLIELAVSLLLRRTGNALTERKEPI
ncbi:MAG: ABC transporter permease subunit, partial [Clostridia bacterium]|nr:ABC transporter permease subunit [Clostridia bacterium]